MLSDFDQSLIMWAVTTIAGALGGYVLAWWRGRRHLEDAMSDGVRELLLCKLEEFRATMVRQGGVADDDLKFRAQRLYNCYHQLGGNGHGTAVNDDIQRAPITHKPL
ncbi:DUF4436 domain-containing protein [Bifidobacterium vansinderenii]|uniref:Phage minor structural protein n=1 Tax=Bifidobacterium vansinderenii TaxID=1984871 RepID=A0A229VY41_9BIFI|nr:DUF4436 domain-containing protein [Bifidobacterium vansinderenii]OXM99280.1 hypothetical protein Tam10B_2478 [Bifidobacterium vansinderenii]OXN00517.1 hypothetical protein Tam10B_1387 [Bifidobacterium vansinderenii]